MNEFEKEDEIVNTVLKQLGYDIYKEIIAQEQETGVHSYERFIIRGALLEYYEWRKANEKK